MTYEMTGTVKTVMEVVTFPSGFRKQMFVVTTPDKFPQDVQFECLKDKTTLLDNVRPGDEVVVKFAVQGREYNGKYFVSLVARGVHNHSDRVDSGEPGVDSGESSFDTGAVDDDQLAF
jgi:single-strand DNA-binding protein